MNHNSDDKDSDSPHYIPQHSHMGEEKTSLSLTAESKTQGEVLQPPRPPNEEKKHWSTTEHGALVARATAHVYRAIIASQQQGGMRDFLEEKCGLFLDITGEQSLDCTLAFQHYEKHIEESLEAFAKAEGKTSLQVMQIIESVSSSHKMAAKNLDMLLAATGYNKFSKMMHRKAVEMEALAKQRTDEGVRSTADLARARGVGRREDRGDDHDSSKKNNNNNLKSDTKCDSDTDREEK